MAKAPLRRSSSKMRSSGRSRAEGLLGPVSPPRSSSGYGMLSFASLSPKLVPITPPSGTPDSRCPLKKPDAKMFFPPHTHTPARQFQITETHSYKNLLEGRRHAGPPRKYPKLQLIQAKHSRWLHCLCVSCVPAAGSSLFCATGGVRQS